jgi:hypothetical protein
MVCNDGDPTGLTIEECVAYYAYDMRQKDRVEQLEVVQIGRHCLRLAQTRNCNVKGFFDELLLLALPARF